MIVITQTEINILIIFGIVYTSIYIIFLYYMKFGWVKINGDMK
jgi:hypothetical protein